MRDHARQHWLVPLLAVPLSQIALSPSCAGEVLERALLPDQHDALRQAATGVSDVVAEVVASEGSDTLTDVEALVLFGLVHPYIAAGFTALAPSHLLLRAPRASARRRRRTGGWCSANLAHPPADVRTTRPAHPRQRPAQPQQTVVARRQRIQLDQPSRTRRCRRDSPWP